jgi:hypothetical protein
MIPEPVTPPERDAGLRRQTTYDLEVTLVGFLTKLFSGARLDNPTLNLSQATQPEPLVVLDPDLPPVSYDPATRMQTLALKQPPRVCRGRVPRTVTGEIALDKLPDVPNIIVQAIKAKVEQPSTIVTVRILFSTYDENPDSSGYQDCLNLIEAAAMALTSFGQAGIDQAYPIQMPIEWTLVEPDCFPHFVGEMTTTWELPSARPLPDDVYFGIVPAEHIELRATYPGDTYPPPPPAYVPPPAPQLIYSWPLEKQDDSGNSYGVQGAASDTDPFAMLAAYQALVLPQGGKLTSAKLFVKAKGGLFDTVVQLYAATGAEGAMQPTGPVLATSNVLPNASLVAGGSLQEFIFSGANQYALQAEHAYAFVFTYAGAFPPQGEAINVGINWAQTPPNNGGYRGQSWSVDDWATWTLYLYAL